MNKDIGLFLVFGGFVLVRLIVGLHRHLWELSILHAILLMITVVLICVARRHQRRKRNLQKTWDMLKGNQKNNVKIFNLIKTLFNKVKDGDE